MGNYTVSKGILLDERDFEGAPHAGLESLAERIHDHLADEFELEEGWPLLEVLGVASERFDGTHIFGFESTRPQWIDAEGDFRSALLAEYERLRLPEPEALLRLAETAPTAVEPGLRQKICEQVLAGAYRHAERLMSALADIREVRLPGIRTEDHFSREGDEELLDFRQANHGPGTRLLAEIAFNWGQ